MRSKELVIIGGGPAGVSAAVEAANRGVSVALIDESSALGGKVLRADEKAIGRAGEIESRIGNRLFNEFTRASDKIEVYLNTEVWSVHDDTIVELHALRESDPQVRRIKAKTLLLATGAMDRTIPFPGWTLPGVFTVGGLNNFVKRGVLPGKRVLVAGSGPLLLALAYNLIKGGAEVSAIVQTTSVSALAARGWRLLMGAGVSKLWQGCHYLWAIRGRRVPVYSSHAVIEAQGNGKVAGARIAKVDGDCRPMAGTEKLIPADVVAVSYGLIPELGLARLCGCEQRFDPQTGYWQISRDENFETTVSGIYTAGDGVRINGYASAMEEGRAAAISACARLGKVAQQDADRITAPWRKKLQDVERFTRTLDALALPGTGLFDIVTEETIVCRCEEVTMGDIRTAVANGARDVNDVKRRTRCGMGHCQGRFCGQAINELIWRLTDTPHERGVFTARIPVKPITFGTLVWDEESAKK